MNAPQDIVARAGEALVALRARRPRVHCLMNTVVQKFVADGLSAMGTLPSMTSSVDEIAHFVAGADGLLINLGTLDAARREAIGIAVETANAHGLRWCLDPVHCDASPPRFAFAKSLIAKGPAVVRGNRQEMERLVGSADHLQFTPNPSPQGAGELGVGASVSPSPLRGGVRGGGIHTLRSPIVFVQTGPRDQVWSGDEAIDIANGHEWLALTTGTGCLTGALISAFLSVEPYPVVAAAAALLAIGVAAEIAADESRGPGSFVSALIDALHALDPNTLRDRARISHAET